jgi:hypothetical protein
MPKNWKFETVQYASVSTAYLPEGDHELLLNPQAPGHIANHNHFYDSIFYTPPAGEEEEFGERVRSFGLSEQFIEIVTEAGAQGLSYVRFGGDEGEVEGIAHWIYTHQTTVPTV